jgi:glycosyltransferase 2 family protein
LKKLKTLLFTLAKISGSLLILAFLFYWALKKPGDFDKFLREMVKPKHWDLLAAAFLVMLGGVIITLIRWLYLVRSVGIVFSISDTMRIGFLGYLFNLMPAGIVGGDLLKAWMISREHPGTRARAFASVIVDRIIGLYVLFLIAAVGIFATRFWQLPDRGVHLICMGVIACVAIGTVGIVVLMIPGVLGGRLIESLTRIPRAGRHIGSLLDALRLYRKKPMVVFVSALMTVPVHILFVLSVILIADGLRFTTVPAVDYFAIFPVSAIATTIPLPAGPTEWGITFLYSQAIQRATRDPAILASAGQQGLVLALVYRLSTIMVAPIGMAYYFLGARKEVKDVWQEAEEDELKPANGENSDALPEAKPDVANPAKPDARAEPDPGG